MLTTEDIKRIGVLIEKKINKADLVRRADIKEIALKKDLRGFARKKDLIRMKNRMIKRINIIADYCSNHTSALELRADRIEKHLNLSPITT
jgi:hypothetical protein